MASEVKVGSKQCAIGSYVRDRFLWLDNPICRLPQLVGDNIFISPTWECSCFILYNINLLLSGLQLI